MANAIYPKFKQHLLAGDIDLDLNTVTAYLMDAADYTYSSAHDLLADLTVAGRVASVALSSVTYTSGTVDSADPTWTAVTGDVSEQIVLTVTNGGSTYLMAFFDTSITGIPVTPNGGNIAVTVNASGWFTL